MMGYSSYWFDGSYLGPRFLFPLAPVAVLWSARFPRTVREALGTSRFGERWAEASLGIMVLSGLALGVPARARLHEGLYEERRADAREVLGSSNVRDALVLVPTSWEDQVNARLWALDVPRSDARRLSDGIGFCALDLALSRLERRQVRSRDAVQALLPLVEDSARQGLSPAPAGELVNLDAEAEYPPVCRSRLDAKRNGVFSFLPFHLQTGFAGNLFARDLHERNPELLSRHPDRPVFVLRPDSGSAGARLEPLDLDSARVLWGWT
jgi:hypothetical protein